MPSAPIAVQSELSQASFLPELMVGDETSDNLSETFGGDFVVGARVARTVFGMTWGSFVVENGGLRNGLSTTDLRQIRNKDT